ncbi:MAG: NADPH-dependent glutamate synthase [Candidatus Adiutrix sp.]|jgi:glutamate synthase (NADPH/NADH) small chain|nr:NADPH-dependent glutamate synthase [Candidatus Adiutrix sp.]
MSEQMPRQPMPEQPAAERRHNFKEVPLGYSPETARAEAGRCIQCKKPGCVSGCPVGIDIPAFIKPIADGDLPAAVAKLAERTALPAVCGRVCPQESQCEAQCVLGKKGAPVAIGRLERYAADWARADNYAVVPPKAPATGKKAAVIGSGPAALTVAGDLILKGHEVTVFEALHQAGGVLVYGIPEFRLPKAIVQRECDNLAALGVRFELNSVIGRLKTIDELLEEHDVAFVAVGAGTPTMLGIPGENLVGVFSANEYLTRSNLMKAYLFPQYDTPMYQGKNVAVFGAGNVAMDAARSALRLGAENVKIIYRRSREEIPARAEEVHHAEEEGVELCLLSAPLEFIGDEQARLTGVKLEKMELGEPDASGRRRPVPLKGSEYVIDLNLAVVAVGTASNPLITNTTPGLAVDRRGYIVAEDSSGKTKKPRVWAGGDIVTGAATVILAMGAGRAAADSMHQFLTWGW